MTRSEYLPAKQMTAEEFAEFQRKGCKINYGDERMDKQILNDIRHEDRARRHPLMDIVIEVVAKWDCSEYLGRNRRAVRDILALSRNDRRRKLEGLSTKARRHQQTLRLAHALVFDDLNAAEYCRRHKLDKADASRMLQHLYEKEPGLADAIGAISACATVTFWQFRQRQQLFRNKERRPRIVYGWEYRESTDNGELCDYAGSIRSIVNGRFKPSALLRDVLYDEPSEPLDLHRPATWTRRWTWTHWDREPVGFWDALYEPMRAIELYDVPLRYGVFDRYREISRNVRLKNGKCATWKPIGRATLIWDWDTRPLGYYPQRWHPAPDIWIGWDPTQARYQTFAIVADSYPGDYRGSRTVSVRYEGKGRFIRLERWIHELRWSAVTMCNSPRWIALPPFREPHGLITPFTRPNWIPVPVKDYETAVVQHYEVNEMMNIKNREINKKTSIPIYLVRKVT